MTKKRKPTKDAVEILDRRYYKGKPERQAALEEARANDAIARKIYDLRTEAGLTQRQLAKLVGTTASVICLLEDRAGVLWIGTSKGIAFRNAGRIVTPDAPEALSEMALLKPPETVVEIVDEPELP